MIVEVKNYIDHKYNNVSNKLDKHINHAFRVSNTLMDPCSNTIYKCPRITYMNLVLIKNR